jgi:LysR family glycine cleavage system transcriptional activator
MSQPPLAAIRAFAAASRHESLGFETLRARGALSFDTIPAALEAAVHGQGVVLGLAPLIRGSNLSDRLVSPFETPLRSAGAYFLVHRRTDRNRGSVQAFTAWIRQEMRRTRLAAPK